MLIDKERKYLVGDYAFLNFIALNDEQAAEVLHWRNAPQIRRYMYNTEEIPLDSHLRFIKSLSDREDAAYWLVSKSGSAVGVMSLTDIDSSTSKANSGYYLIPEMLGSGIGLEFVYTITLFVLSCIGCKSLWGSINKNNINALLVAAYLGWHFNEDDLRNLKEITYIRNTLDANDFLRKKDELNNVKKFVHYIKSNKEFLII